MIILKVLVLVIVLSSCVSLNSHQTGRSLGKNNQEFSGSLSFGYTQDINYFSIGEDNKYYFADLRYRGGISENLDLGINLNLASFFIITSKYQFIGSKKSIFASSVGVDIGATPVTLLHALTLGYTGSLKSYNSIHFSDRFALTFTPAYIFLGFSKFSEGYGGSYHSNENLLGYTTGIIIGKKHKISVELSKIASFDKVTINPQPTFSLGYIFTIN